MEQQIVIEWVRRVNTTLLWHLLLLQFHLIQPKQKNKQTAVNSLPSRKLSLISFVFLVLQLSKDNQFIKLLRDACINFLRVIGASGGLAKDDLHATTVHGLSSLFCNTVRSGNQDWCNLNLVRSVAQSQQLCRSFSTKPWVDMLLNFISPIAVVGGNEMNLPKQASFVWRYINNLRIRI